ncbi:hypothetical protein [Cryptosporangium aurantiacum]|uniref:PKD domain-containing protein n=1 Tax=Cryptosporangium aurantiacum TaxID=134849 RepID=A0A1M7RKX4_9ACTN|nr:hypothetical protein [Cryptosporangium aurantiacum]SHN46790.1 hypothetical protein SAMN05443668_11819 [Cryptosporangium aurantiacum]
MWRRIGSARRAAGVGALGLLAVPAFLIGAGLGDSSPAGRYGPTAVQAPGRAAVDSPSATPQAVSPASDRQARDAVDLSTAPPEPRTAPGLRLRVVAPDGPLTADELVQFRVRWSDGNGRYAGLAEDWGDGTAASSLEVVGCRGDAGPHSGELTTAHRFPVGRYRVRLTVTTADCDGRTEARSAEVTIDVRPADDRNDPDGRSEPPAEDDGSGLPILPTDPGSTPPSGPTATTSTPASPLPSVESLGHP